MLIRLVLAALALVCASHAGAAPASDDLVSFSMKDASLLRVIEVLVHERDLNIVAPPGLDRKVTVRLKDVPWRQALNLILREHGYGFELVGNIIRVDTLENLQERPARTELTVRHLQREELESLARSAVGTGAFEIVESPSAPGRARSLTLVADATPEEQRALSRLVQRFDRPPRAAAVKVVADGPDAVTVAAEGVAVGPLTDRVSKALGLNVTWEDPPRGRASVHVERASVREALGAILVPLGYTFDISKNMLTIGLRPAFEAQVETRVFRLVYANALHVKSAIEPMLSRRGKIEVFGVLPPGAAGAQATTVAAAQAAAAQVNAQGTQRPLGRGQPAQSEIQRTLPPSDKIVVTDVPGVIARIAEVLRELDRPPLQVDIETQLVEVTLTRDSQLGIRWNTEISATGAMGNKVRFPLGEREVRAANVAQNFQLGVLSAANFTALLRALSRRNKLRVLSSPRVATISNTPARILIGQRFPITVQSLNQQTAFTTVTLDYFEDIGIVLTVTPRVTDDKTVHLTIKPQVSSIASLVDNRFPVIDTREAESQLSVESGHTAVIGGLVQDRFEKDEEGIPGLAHIGALGRLFGLHRRSKRRTELLVCVTPRILDPGKSPEPQSRASSSSARE